MLGSRNMKPLSRCHARKPQDGIWLTPKELYWTNWSSNDDRHMRIYVWRLALFVLVASPLWPAGSSTSESSFQLSPAPIPYPYFDPGTTDGKIDISYVNLSLSGYTFNGLSVFGKARKAFTDTLALDGMVGLMYLTGNMPGIGPISPLPAYSAAGAFLGYYTPIPAKTGTATALTVSFSGNAEGQVIRTPFFNAIVFAGPALNITSFTFSVFASSAFFQRNNSKSSADSMLIANAKSLGL